MQIEKNKDIIYFAVDNLSWWHYNEVKSFLDKRVGHEIVIHVGHNGGNCMCHSNHLTNFHHFGSLEMLYYPCLYLIADIESVVDVKQVDKYEGSTSFTLGGQYKDIINNKSIVVGLKMKSDINRELEIKNNHKHYTKRIRNAQSKVSDMSKVFGICIPSFASKVFFLQEYPKFEDTFVSNKDVSASFTENDASARFIGDEYKSKLSDYSIDDNYKYHTLLCN